jgi:hypothetical protein
VGCPDGEAGVIDGADRPEPHRLVLGNHPDARFDHASRPPAALDGTRRLLLSPRDRPLSRIMVKAVVTIPRDATVLNACEFFILHKLLAFPVVDEDAGSSGGWKWSCTPGRSVTWTGARTTVTCSSSSAFA